MSSRRAVLLVAAIAVAGLALSSAVASASPSAMPLAVSAPTLIPTSESVSSNPTLSWYPVSGAIRYHVQIAASGSFGTKIYDKDTVGLQVTPDTDLPLGALYWKVAAVDASNIVGPYSDTGSFTKQWDQAPQPITPADGATRIFPTDPAVFTWRPLPGAKSYELQVDDAADFVGATTYPTVNTSYVLADPQTVGQTFFWHVRALSTTTGVLSDWSSPRSYSFVWPSAPTLLTPAFGAVVADPSLSWEPVAGADTYQVQINPNQDFTNNMTTDTIVKGAAYSPPVALPNGSYWWRVRPIDATTPGHKGDWSAAWLFRRPAPDAPTVVAPLDINGGADGIADVAGPPTLSWTPVDHAAYYELEISTDPAFPPYPLTSFCTTNHTRWTPLTELTPPLTTLPPLPPAPPIPPITTCSPIWQPGLTYYWAVRAVDAPTGVVGIWSSVSTGAFRLVRGVTAPTYTSPADGASVSVPALAWDEVNSALNYLVTIKDSDGNTVVDKAKTYSPSYAPSIHLPDGLYSWYVQSTDAQGFTTAVLTDAPMRTFVLENEPAGQSPDPVSPAASWSGLRTPPLAWIAVTGAASYKVHLSVNGTEQTQWSSPINAFTWTGVPALLPGDYSWWVDALDGSGHNIITGVESTFTISRLTDTRVAGYATSYQTTEPQSDVPCQDNIICFDTPTMRWNDVAGVTSYDVTVATDPDFTTAYRRYTTIFATLTPRESFLDSQAGQAYYWFVTPCIDYPSPGHRVCSAGAQDPVANANAPSFKKQSAPVTLCPPNTSVASSATLCPLSQIAPDAKRQITFSWMDYLSDNALPSATGLPETQEAKQYRIQVAIAPDFASPIDTQVVDGTSYTPTTITYPDGPLYWHVQAIDDNGNYLTWSPVAEIDRTMPTPVQDVTVDHNEAVPPTPPTVTGVPLLTWTPSSFASKYTVEIYRNNDTNFSTGNLVAPAATSKFAAYAPSLSLAPGTYTWRVQGVDAGGHPGPWWTDNTNVDPKTMTFTIVPAYPSLIAPDTSPVLTSGNVLFTWTSVSTAVKYRWQLSVNQGFSSITATMDTVMPAWSPLTRLRGRQLLLARAGSRRGKQRAFDIAYPSDHEGRHAADSYCDYS